MAKSTNITRRAMLAGVGAMPIALSMPVIAASNVAASPELLRLLAQHAAATAHFEVVCKQVEDIDDPSQSPAWCRAAAAEERARGALLACPLRGLDDVRALARHFVARLAPDHGDFEDAWAAQVLMRNLARAEA